MGLPKINSAVFNFELPSTGKKIQYRAFTVAEEKILLLAQESKDREQVVTSIKQIIRNCVIDDIDVNELPLFDVELLLMNIRAKSVDNVIEFMILDDETEEKIELSFDVNDFEVKKFENHDDIISITDTISLKMKYPNLDSILKIKDDGNNSNIFSIIEDCIDSVIDGEQVYQLKTFDSKEVDEFINSLDSVTLQKIKEFFDSMPVLRLELPYKTKDGKDKKYVMEGTETFFM